MADHPSHDTWELLATGELATDERKVVMAHVVGCPACARTWRVVKEIAAEARDFDPGVPALAPDESTGRLAPVAPSVVVRDVEGGRRVTPALRRVRRALFAGGAGALVAAAVLLLWIRGAAQPTEGPAGDPGTIRGSAEPEVVLVSASGARLAWRPVQNAQHYRVEVFSRDGALVWSRDEVTATTVEVAPKLAPADYRWHVEAWVSGARIAVSIPARFTVAP